jgi:hypothetical protein
MVDVKVWSDGGRPGSIVIVGARGPGAGSVSLDEFCEKGGGFVAV